MIKNKFALPISLVLLTAITALADKLVINSNQSNPAGKALFTKLVEEFKKQNPDLEVVFNTTDHEGYKTAIRNWLTTEPPDIVFWFSGNRMKAFDTLSARQQAAANKKVLRQEQQQSDEHAAKQHREKGEGGS